MYLGEGEQPRVQGEVQAGHAHQREGRLPRAAGPHHLLQRLPGPGVAPHRQDHQVHCNINNVKKNMYLHIMDEARKG